MSYGIALGCLLLALAGQGVFGVWVFLLGLGRFPEGEGLPLPWSVALDAALLILFGLQHSGMARHRFKNWWTRFIPAILERSVYVGCSGLALLLLFFAWQPLPGEPLWRLPFWFSGIALAGGLGVGWVTMAFDPARLLGWRQVREQGKALETDTLQIVGPYRFVRHPQMAALLVFLWGHAVMPPTLLLLSSGLTVYILFALRWEEKDLQRRFGQRYTEYRKQVPALIPWRPPVPRATYPPLS